MPTIPPRMEKNSFAMALFFASHRWGDGEGIYAYEKEARGNPESLLYIREVREGREHPCGICRIIRFCSYLVLILQILLIICHISMNCSVSGRMRKTGISGRRQQWQAVNIWCRHAPPITGMSAEYAEFDGSPMSRKLG